MNFFFPFSKKKYDKTPYVSLICHPPNFLYKSPKGWANTPSRFFARILGLLFKPYLKKKDIEAVRNADLVISISEYTSKRIKSIYGVEPVLIYPPILDFFKLLSEKGKKKFIKSKRMEKPFLLAHGRVIPDKNYKMLIPLMHKFNNFNLIISGSIDKAYHNELEKEIRAQNLQDRIKILGRIPKNDLLGYYNTASLFLLPAPKEDFGMTMVESIACGCPVIAWDDGAGPSEVLNKENGLLAKPYKGKDFAEKIKKGLTKKWNRKKVASSINKFREKAVAKKFLSEINKIKK